MATVRPGIGAQSFRPSLARIAAALDGVGPEGIAAADRRAVASVRRAFEPAAKRVIRQTYGIQAKELAGKFRVTVDDMGQPGQVIKLNASMRKTPLQRFGARWVRGRTKGGGYRSKGATAAIERGQRKVYHSAFIAAINGQDHVLVRQFSRDSNSPSGRDPRNKLRRLSGPSPYQMVRGIGDANAERLVEEMNELRSREIVRLLRLTRQGKF